MELEAEFCLHPYLNADRRIQLAKTTSLTERQVKIWFLIPSIVGMNRAEFIFIARFKTNFILDGKTYRNRD